MAPHNHPTMLSALSRCIEISQSLLPALVAPPAHTTSPDPYDLKVFNAILGGGIAPIHHPRIPAQLASQLHAATQAHFRRACSAIETTGRPSHLPSLQTLASELRQTFSTLYRNKVDHLASALARKTPHFTEKQPFANDILMYAYEQSQSPNRREREQLARLTGLSLEQVRVWFQNRRQRMKKRAPELQARSALQLDDVLARVAASRKAAEDEFDDNDSGYCSGSDQDRYSPMVHRVPKPLTISASTSRSFPAPYTPCEPSTTFLCEPPIFRRTAAAYPPVHVQPTSVAELAHLMSRLTLRHRRQTPRSSAGSATSAVSVATTSKSAAKGKKAVANSAMPATSPDGASTRKKAARKDPETGRKVAGRRGASTASPSSSAAIPASTSSPSISLSMQSVIPSVTEDSSAKPRKRAGPLRRKPAGKALARQASESSVASTSSSDSSRSTSYSSDFSFASDSSFTSVESVPTAARMECFQPQQQPQFDPLAAFDFTQLFSTQPSDPLPQPVADFELPPDLLAGLQMPMDTAALPPPESTDFLALLNDPTIQDLLQSVQDMDVVEPQQTQESLTFNDTLDVGSVDTSGFLDLSASTLPTFDAMFGLDASSFQDTLWNSPGFSLPITV